MSYLISGDPAGRRVIFIHGTPGEARGWADFLLHPLPGYEYVAIDRPGFGASGPDGAVVRLAEQAAALEPLLVARSGQWPILVGHSLGGPVVVQAAVDHPGRVGALVIAAGSLDPGLEKIHWAQPIGAWDPVRRRLSRPMRNANAELMALKPELQQLASRLPQLTCRVEIVHGEKDRLVPYANVAFMRGALRQADVRVRTLPSQDHFLPWTSRAEIEAAIARAAQGLGPCR